MDIAELAKNISAVKIYRDAAGPGTFNPLDDKLIATGNGLRI